MTDDPPAVPISDDAVTDWLTLRLTTERPAPAAGLQAALRRRLLAMGPSTSRPPRLRLLVASYAIAGAALLVLGALSIAGAGPLST